MADRIDTWIRASHPRSARLTTARVRKETRPVRFVPSEFEVPDLLEHDRFRLRPLTVHDLVKDYDAVMSSQEHLWDQFGQAWGWPSADLTLEQDLIDLGWHQKEFQRRSSFAYAVMSPDEMWLRGRSISTRRRRRAHAEGLWVRASARHRPGGRAVRDGAPLGRGALALRQGRLPRPGARGARRREVIQDDAETGPVGVQDLGVAGGAGPARWGWRRWRPGASPSSRAPTAAPRTPR